MLKAERAAQAAVAGCEQARSRSLEAARRRARGILERTQARTERRARAIENVLLPEIEWSLKFVDEQLEILDQEEIARVRQGRPGGPS